jgi:hypothetical protein
MRMDIELPTLKEAEKTRDYGAVSTSYVFEWKKVIINR